MLMRSVAVHVRIPAVKDGLIQEIQAVLMLTNVAVFHPCPSKYVSIAIIIHILNTFDSQGCWNASQIIVINIPDPVSSFTFI